MAKKKNESTLVVVLDWVMSILTFLAFLSATVYAGIWILNVNFIHDYTNYPGAPGELYSARYGYQYFMVFISTMCIIVAPVIIYFGKGIWIPTGEATFWLAFLCVFIVFHFLSFMSLSTNKIYCLRDGTRKDICNPLEYCCVTDFWNNPLNGCPNTDECTTLSPPVTMASDLKENPDFTRIYWTSVGHLCFEVFAIIFIITQRFIHHQEMLVNFKPLTEVAMNTSLKARMLFNNNRRAKMSKIK